MASFAIRSKTTGSRSRAPVISSRLYRVVTVPVTSSCEDRESRRLVRREPREKALPPVRRRCLVVTRPVVREKGVSGAGIDLDFSRLVGRRQGLAHLLDGRHRDALVLAAVEAQH